MPAPRAKAGGCFCIHKQPERASGPLPAREARAGLQVRDLPGECGDDDADPHRRAAPLGEGEGGAGCI